MLYNTSNSNLGTPPWKKQRPVLTRLRRCMTLLSAESGETLLEFALASTVLLMVIFGVMDCSRALYADHYVRYSAEEAARYAMVRGYTWKNAACTATSTESCTATAADVTSLVKSITPPGISNDSHLVVSTTWTGKNPAGASCGATTNLNLPGCVVQVQVSYTFSFVLPFLPKNALVLTSASAIAISQ
jgi:Flp pilus assembly protein TadG